MTIHARTMHSTIKQCPEDSNSTDCLLRSLLSFLTEQQESNDAEVNWDPISFAFTLLIGLLALIFALVTIAQAVLATGKSRRITSNRAIGKWSTETRRTWSWTQMNFQYTASTPVLLESLFPAVSKQPKESGSGHKVAGKSKKREIQDNSNVAHTELPQGNAAKTKRSTVASLPCNQGTGGSQLKGFNLWSGVPKSSPSRHPPSAAWLEFFKELGLDKLEISHWNNSIREVSADHLPDDIVAAPAYGQVGAIIAAAATTGIQKLYIDQQKYPIVLGRGFQIDFRQHPALGLIGAYSRYGKANNHERSGNLNFKELRLAMRHGRGDVPSKKTMSVYTKSKRRRLVGRWYLAQQPWLYDSDTGSNQIFFINMASISEEYIPLIVGLRAYTPKFVPALFPIASMRIRFPLIALALNGTYWAEENLHKFRDSHIFQWPTTRFAKSWDGFVWHDVGDPLLRQDIDVMYSDLEATYVDYLAGMENGSEETADAPIRASKAYDGYRVVLHMCLKLLYQPVDVEGWLFEASPLEQRALRLIILEQMKEVDLWLDSRGTD